jgi:hypothetical protein
MVQIFGNKNLEDLKQGDVEGLINRGEEESIILEFKKELGSDSKEIAKDLSSMANAEGGLVIYGVEEDDNGKAKSIEWIDSLNFEEKIENIISTTINPIIPFKIIPVSREEENTKKVYIILLPKSNNLHMVIKGNDNRYYKRSGKTVRRMEDREIKERIRAVQINSEDLDEVISSIKAEFQEFGTNLSSIQRINYYVIPDVLNEKIETIDDLKSAANSIRSRVANGSYVNSYRGTIANVMFTDQRKWQRSTILHKNGIIEFRRSHDYATGYGASAEAAHLIELVNYANNFYKKIQYFGGYRIYMEIGNIGQYWFADDMMANPRGIYNYSLGELQEFIEIDSLLVQNEAKNKLKILELIRTVGGTIGVNGEAPYRDVKASLGI